MAIGIRSVLNEDPPRFDPSCIGQEYSVWSINIPVFLEIGDRLLLLPLLD